MINGLRIAAITCLHFGVDYLPYAMRSVSDVVDEYIINYSPVPNHGTYQSSIPNPETRAMLIEAAYSVVPDRTRWFDFDGWKSEGEQFKAGWQYTNADVIVKLDADEIWYPGLLAEAIEYGLAVAAYEIRLPLRHYWRSMRKAFTHDPAAPGRVYLRRESGAREITFTGDDPNRITLKLRKDIPDIYGYLRPHSLVEDDFDPTPYRIHHFGYALPVDVTRYKMSIHGHLREFKNPNWFDEVWLANRQTDCHPCGSDYWMKTEDVSVPEFLKDHPFAGLEIIE